MSELSSMNAICDGHLDNQCGHDHSVSKNAVLVVKKKRHISKYSSAKREVSESSQVVSVLSQVAWQQTSQSSRIAEVTDQVNGAIEGTVSSSSRNLLPRYNNRPRQRLTERLRNCLSISPRNPWYVRNHSSQQPKAPASEANVMQMVFFNTVIVDAASYNCTTSKVDDSPVSANSGSTEQSKSTVTTNAASTPPQVQTMETSQSPSRLYTMNTPYLLSTTELVYSTVCSESPPHARNAEQQHEARSPPMCTKPSLLPWNTTQVSSLIVPSVDEPNRTPSTEIGFTTTEQPSSSRPCSEPSPVVVGRQSTESQSIQQSSGEQATSTDAMGSIQFGDTDCNSTPRIQLPSETKSPNCQSRIPTAPGVRVKTEPPRVGNMDQASPRMEQSSPDLPLLMHATKPISILSTETSTIQVIGCCVESHTQGNLEQQTPIPEQLTTKSTSSIRGVQPPRLVKSAKQTARSEREPAPRDPEAALPREKKLHDCVHDILSSHNSISSRLYTLQEADTTTDQVRQNSSTLYSQIRVEVKPNVFLELRSAMETLRAIDSGLASCVKCTQCHGTLKCVPDAELVMCPDCRIMSPMSMDVEVRSTSEQPNHIPVGRRGGVGLGLKVPSC